MFVRNSATVEALTRASFSDEQPPPPGLDPSQAAPAAAPDGAWARDAPGAVRADTTRGTEAQNSMCGNE